MEKHTRLKSILSKAISILVIVINLALVTFVWIIQDDVSSATVSILTEVDNVARVIRSGLDRVEPQLGHLRDLVGQVEAASEEIAGNVSEEGILPRLLPQTVTETLTSSSQSLRDNFTAVYDLLAATSDVLLALDNIPFVDLPEQGLSTIASLQASMEGIAEQVESLTTAINDARAEAGARISQVTNAAAFLGAEADQLRADLMQIDADLDAIQISVRKYQRLTPPVILSAVIILSLLSGWVVYSQVNIILRSEKSVPIKSSDDSTQPEPSQGEENLE